MVEKRNEKGKEISEVLDYFLQFFFSMQMVKSSELKQTYFAIN